MIENIRRWEQSRAAERELVRLLRRMGFGAAAYDDSGPTDGVPDLLGVTAPDAVVFHPHVRLIEVRDRQELRRGGWAVDAADLDNLQRHPVPSAIGFHWRGGWRFGVRLHGYGWERSVHGRYCVVPRHHSIGLDAFAAWLTDPEPNRRWRPLLR